TAMQSAVELETPAAVAAPPASGGSQPSLEGAKGALAAGNVAEAERMIRLLLVDDPDRDEYQAVLGQVYLRKGHASIAYDILQPIAKAWIGKNRRQEALEIIDAFLAVETEDADFLALKAQASGTPPPVTVESAGPSAQP